MQFGNGYKFTFLLLVWCYYDATFVQCDNCPVSKINSCTEGLGSLDFNNLQNMCKALKEIEGCLHNAENTCVLDEESQKALNIAKKQINSIKPACIAQTGKTCQKEANQCLANLEKVYKNKEVPESKICQEMSKASSCLSDVYPSCDSNAMKAQIENSINQFVEEGQRLGCKSKGYRVKGRGAGVRLLPAPVLLVLSVIFIVLLLHKL